MILFLDIDGVMCLNGEALDEGCMENLNRLMDAHPPLKVVFNTAWNIKPLDEMRHLFIEAGFRHHSGRLLDQTDSSEGGQAPIQRWFKKHGNQRYAILDDTSNYEAMTCNLVQCSHLSGLGAERVQWRISSFFYGGREKTTCLRVGATEKLLAQARVIRERCSWLSAEQKRRSAQETLKKIENIVLMSDEEFEVAACL